MCTIRVSVAGPLSHLSRVENALGSAPLTGLQLHSDINNIDTNKDKDKRDVGGSDYDGDNESDGSHDDADLPDTDTDATILYYNTDSDVTRLNSESDVPDIDSDETRLNSDTNLDSDETRLNSDTNIDSDETRLNSDATKDVTPDTDITPLLPARKRLLHVNMVRKVLFKRVRTDLEDDTGTSTESIDTPPRLRQTNQHYTNKVRKIIYDVTLR